jgi:hypothetical protein
LFPVSLSTLRLAASVLTLVEWSMDRSIVMDLRREIGRWISRIYPYNPPQSMYSQPDILNQALFWWSTKLEMLTESSISPKDAIHRALEWIIRIHLDSLCFGFTSVTNRTTDSTGKTIEETIQIDRATATLQSLGFVCRRDLELPVHPLVSKIFGDTCADIARTLSPSGSVKSILETIERFPDLDPVKISRVSQQVMSEVAFAQFLVVEKKIEQRLDSQYSKAKKWATLEELGELENRKRNPPLWEFYGELLGHEPEV